MRNQIKDMKGKRRNHSPEFKARIALEALKGLKTVQQIAADTRDGEQVTLFKIRRRDHLIPAATQHQREIKGRVDRSQAPGPVEKLLASDDGVAAHSKNMDRAILPDLGFK